MAIVNMVPLESGKIHSDIQNLTLYWNLYMKTFHLTEWIYPGVGNFNRNIVQKGKLNE